MKKILLGIAFIGFFSILLSSCKSHERCPAYGKVDSVKTEKNA
jgi:hypothetical protein